MPSRSSASEISAPSRIQERAYERVPRRSAGPPPAPRETDARPRAGGAGAEGGRGGRGRQPRRRRALAPRGRRGGAAAEGAPPHLDGPSGPAQPLRRRIDLEGTEDQEQAR